MFANVFAPPPSIILTPFRPLFILLYDEAKAAQKEHNLILYLICLVSSCYIPVFLFDAFYESEKDRHNKITLKTDIDILTFFCFCHMSNPSPITRKLCLILRFQLHSFILPLLLIFKPPLIICFGFVSR